MHSFLLFCLLIFDWLPSPAPTQHSSRCRAAVPLRNPCSVLCLPEQFSKARLAHLQFCGPFQPSRRWQLHPIKWQEWRCHPSCPIYMLALVGAASVTMDFCISLFGTCLLSKISHFLKSSNAILLNEFPLIHQFLLQETYRCPMGLYFLRSRLSRVSAAKLNADY